MSGTPVLLEVTDTPGEKSRVSGAGSATQTWLSLPSAIVAPQELLGRGGGGTEEELLNSTKPLGTPSAAFQQSCMRLRAASEHREEPSLVYPRRPGFAADRPLEGWGREEPWNGPRASIKQQMGQERRWYFTQCTVIGNSEDH